MMVAHFNVYMLGGVCAGTMARGLLNKLTAMGEDECLGRIATGGDAID